LWALRAGELARISLAVLLRCLALGFEVPLKFLAFADEVLE
jgi:hypothetical protein